MLDLASPAGAIPHIDGVDLSLFWVLPFGGILLSIALLPLLAPKFWHHHFGKVAAFWSLAFFLPFAWQFGVEAAVYEFVHTLLLEYLPFIILLVALYTVSGGIRVADTIRATPAMNTAILAIGTVLANIMGTTGAAMLLIRPLLQANAKRRHKVHVVVFFIFLVGNIGGSLTPLGDPPLFLGFLKGVDFFWTARHMALPLAVTASILLAVFYIVDRYCFAKDASRHEPQPKKAGVLRIKGAQNIVLLIAIVAAVVLSGVWRPDIGITVYHVRLEIQDIVRDGLLIAISLISLKWTRAEIRAGHGFTWFPMTEVTKLFAAIFLTIIPAIAILRAGESGALGFLVKALSANGEPVNALYFWTTGLLSSFLDNAPTYLIFFNAAGGDPATLMGPDAHTLLAISAGAVFMGAMTYIGNAPNFLVRSIAEERGIEMPSFFGYMLWSTAFLIPVFILTTFVFFR
jgi:Na+/H+ antiporter NhaD/arsenite permease-like protein